MTYTSKGYHGTSKASGYLIKAKGFSISRGDDHWLGDGAYFFEDDESMAFEWCKAESYKKKYKEYVIIESDIRVAIKNVFDLSEPKNFKFFHSYRDMLLEKIKKGTYSVKVKNKHVLDGAVINEICSIIPYKLVMTKVFVQIKRDRISRDYSRIPNCIIICVKEIDSCIKSTTIHKEGVLNAV